MHPLGRCPEATPLGFFRLTGKDHIGPGPTSANVAVFVSKKNNALPKTFGKICPDQTHYMIDQNPTVPYVYRCELAKNSSTAITPPSLSNDHMGSDFGIVTST